MRAGYIDSLRGLAVVWMVIFHTAYDLRLLGMVGWDFTEGFWWAFPRVIAFTFLLCVGLSMNYAHRPAINWPSLKRRLWRLGLAALLVSLGTYLVFPAHWIYFGTLHCIFVGSLLGALVVNRRPLAWALLGLILLGQYGLGFDIQWVSGLLQRPSMDFIPIYPWFWGILAGILIEPYLSKSSVLRELHPPRALGFLGRHSLKIYLVHQPVIYGSLYLLRTLLSP